MINIALPKGRLASQVFEKMREAGYDISLSDNKRKLVVEDIANNFTYYFVKPSDVITYVIEGVCDIGIVGKDNIIEEEQDIYELLDLNIGVCKMVVAGKNKDIYNSTNQLRIATKYPNTARKYLTNRFPSIYITKLNGSVELGPLVGLSDVIVDIYETGSTLKANNLFVIETLFDISARVIANKASYRLKNNDIKDFITSMEKVGE